MNAAYLMLTTAWLAGQNPAPAAAPPATPVPAAPAAAAPAYGGGPVVSSSLGACNGGGYAGGGCGCGATTDCGCEGGGKLFGKMKGMFKKRGGDCGCEAAPVEHHKMHWAPAAADCGCEGGKGSLFGKLKGKFKKRGDCGGDCGCGSTTGAWGGGCCGTGGGYGGGVIGAPATGTPAEAIPAPPKPGEAPRRAMPTTPMTMNGVIQDVTPAVAPQLGVEQEGPKQPF